LRTPDERFANLPGWNYTPRYTDTLPGYEGLRMPTWTKEPLTLP
jgi:haloalkane dehalogenase